jgi:hypothetical protein
METNPIKFGDDGFSEYGAELLCPNCGHGYLHHEGVVSYDRGEDDALIMMTTVRGQRTSTFLTQNNAQNPSARRDGVAIGFWCEHCHQHWELTIAQHKGKSLCRWRFACSGAPPDQRL